MSMIGGLIGAGLTAGSGILNAIFGAQAYRNSKRILDDSHNKMQSYYNGQIAQDFTTRSDVQSVLSKQKELLADEYKKARARNIVAGGTDESLALMQQGANDTLADTIRGIATQATAHKDNLMAQKMQNEQDYANQQVQLEQQRAGNIASATSSMAKVGGQIMQGADWSWLFGKK